MRDRICDLRDSAYEWYNKMLNRIIMACLKRCFLYPHTLHFAMHKAGRFWVEKALEPANWEFDKREFGI